MTDSPIPPKRIPRTVLASIAASIIASAVFVYVVQPFLNASFHFATLSVGSLLDVWADQQYTYCYHAGQRVVYAFLADTVLALLATAASSFTVLALINRRLSIAGGFVLNWLPTVGIVSLLNLYTVYGPALRHEIQFDRNFDVLSAFATDLELTKLRGEWAILDDKKHFDLLAGEVKALAQK